MTRALLFFALLVLPWLAECVRAADSKQGGRELIVCGREKVFILDLDQRDAAGTPKTIWSWRAADSADLPKETHALFRSTDECKPVAAGRRILITSSTGGVALIDRETKRVLFHGRAANAHSADLLPNGRIAVAASRDPKNNQGDSLILFDVAQSGRELWRGPLPSGHGVVWDEKRQVVWALSDQEITRYQLTDWNSSRPSLTRTGGYMMPEKGGHDLFPVPGTNFLSVSTGERCWLFDRETYALSPHPELGDQAHIKSLNRHPASGQIAFTQAERPNWWTTRIQFLNPADSMSVPGEEFYKVRWNARGE